jgi:hypothetical protein
VSEAVTSPAVSEAVTVYVKLLSPKRRKVTVWPESLTAESDRLLDS